MQIPSPSSVRLAYQRSARRRTPLPRERDFSAPLVCYCQIRLPLPLTHNWKALPSRRKIEHVRPHVARGPILKEVTDWRKDDSRTCYESYPKMYYWTLASTTTAGSACGHTYILDVAINFTRGAEIPLQHMDTHVPGSFDTHCPSPISYYYITSLSF